MKCEFLPALTYSPPISRTTEAILAKLSEPKNRLGFTIMKLPVSSNSNIPASSGVNACFTALMSSFCPAAGVRVVAVVFVVFGAVVVDVGG